jgi:hypothetical protein
MRGGGAATRYPSVTEPPSRVDEPGRQVHAAWRSAVLMCPYRHMDAVCGSAVVPAPAASPVEVAGRVGPARRGGDLSGQCAVQWLPPLVEVHGDEVGVELVAVQDAASLTAGPRPWVSQPGDSAPRPGGQSTSSLSRRLHRITAIVVSRGLLLGLPSRQGRLSWLTRDATDRSRQSLERQRPPGPAMQTWSHCTRSPQCQAVGARAR